MITTGLKIENNVNAIGVPSCEKFNTIVVNPTDLSKVPDFNITEKEKIALENNVYNMYFMGILFEHHQDERLHEIAEQEGFEIRYTDCAKNPSKEDLVIKRKYTKYGLMHICGIEGITYVFTREKEGEKKEIPEQFGRTLQFEGGIAYTGIIKSGKVL